MIVKHTENLARALASMDGKSEEFDHDKGSDLADMDGTYDGYVIKADELMWLSKIGFLLDERDSLLEALEFYADPHENRKFNCVNGHDRCGTPGPNCPYCETTAIPEFYVEMDFGKTARTFLDSKIQNEQ